MADDLTRGADALDQTALFGMWAPARSFAAVTGHLLLILAAILIAVDAIGLVGAGLDYVSAVWAIAVGLALAVLGTNCLNLAFWYPVAWTKSPARNPAEGTPFPDGQRRMVRAIIILQFCAGLAVIIAQGVAGVGGLIATSIGQVANPGLDLTGLSAALILLAGVLDYVLASEARVVAGLFPLGAEQNQPQPWLRRERRSWQTIIAAGRETHKLVIGAIMFFLLDEIAAGKEQLLVLVLVDALALVLVVGMLWCTVVELRHLARIRFRPGRS